MTADAYVTPVNVVDVFADDTYQRPLDPGRARKMGESWERRLAGIIEVSDRGETSNPRYAVIDGQHRWAAAERAGIDVLVANVHTGLTVADEAKLFDRLNRERRRITTWDHWHARRAAGDPDVTTIEKAVTAAGLTIDPAPKAGNVRCTATLEKLYALDGPDLVTASLNVAQQAWGRDVAGFDAPIVHGLGLVLFHLRDELEPARLIEALLEVRPQNLKAAATNLRNMTTGSTAKLVAITVVTGYNRRPGRKILVSARTFGGASRNAHSVRAAK